MLNANQYQTGDYIISGCPNAFNDKTSYWISKKNNTDAYYCFTADTAKEIAEQLANFAGYIALYETMHARLNEN